MPFKNVISNSHLNNGNIIYYPCQLKQDRVYRIAILSLQYSIPLEGINEEKSILFIVDLGPQQTNKDFFNKNW